jgi:hypothetical protein
VHLHLHEHVVAGIVVQRRYGACASSLRQLNAELNARHVMCTHRPHVTARRNLQDQTTRVCARCTHRRRCRRPRSEARATRIPSELFF